MLLLCTSLKASNKRRESNIIRIETAVTPIKFNTFCPDKRIESSRIRIETISNGDGHWEFTL